MHGSTPIALPSAMQLQSITANAAGYSRHSAGVAAASSSNVEMSNACSICAQPTSTADLKHVEDIDCVDAQQVLSTRAQAVDLNISVSCLPAPPAASADASAVSGSTVKPSAEAPLSRDDIQPATANATALAKDGLCRAGADAHRPGAAQPEGHVAISSSASSAGMASQVSAGSVSSATTSTPDMPSSSMQMKLSTEHPVSRGTSSNIVDAELLVAEGPVPPTVHEQAASHVIQDNVAALDISGMLRALAAAPLPQPSAAAAVVRQDAAAESALGQPSVIRPQSRARFRRVMQQTAAAMALLEQSMHQQGSSMSNA